MLRQILEIVAVLLLTCTVGTVISFFETKAKSGPARIYVWLAGLAALTLIGVAL